MSLEGSLVDETEVVFVAEIVESSSEEPPQEEWSSLVLDLPEVNVKKILYSEGLYDPGSGEICAQYIPLSDSAVFRHPYYNYPAVVDPGIVAALHQPEPQIIYPDDGQELYLSLCEEVNLCPIRIFHKNLFNEVIDLKYYSVDPRSIRPMCMALRYNKWVKELNLTDSFLNDDACFHLGDLLNYNTTITELNLSGCRIGPSGLKQLIVNLPVNTTLKTLNLNRNEIGDAGMEYIANAVFLGMHIQNLYLSFNQIGTKGINMLIEVLETHNKLVSLDLSWNNLFASGPLYNLLTRLSENTKLQQLNLSWNSIKDPRVGTGIKNLLKAPSLQILILNNNKLAGAAIKNLIGTLAKAKKLVTLDLSYNPMSPDDALSVLINMKKAVVKLQNLRLDNVFVDDEFIITLENIKRLKFRQNFTCTHGAVMSKFVPSPTDNRNLVLNRAEFLGQKPKKNKVDIALVVLQLAKDLGEERSIINHGEFTNAMRAAKASLDDDLIEEIVNTFAGPRTAKTKTINIQLLVEFITRKWPERKLPPTPPPEPEPEPKGKGKGGKGAKGGKKGKK